MTEASLSLPRATDRARPRRRRPQRPRPGWWLEVVFTAFFAALLTAHVVLGPGDSPVLVWIARGSLIVLFLADAWRCAASPHQPPDHLLTPLQVLIACVVWWTLSPW